MKLPLLGTSIRRIQKHGWRHVVALILIGMTYLGFGLNHLGKFITADEPPWIYRRVPQYYEAIKLRYWEKTYTSDKPGVVTSLFSGFTNQFLDHREVPKNEIERYFFWCRFPLLFLNFLALFLIYYFAQKLIDKDHALLTTLLIAWAPYLIGMSQIVNPDATLWSTGFLSILTYLLYMKSGKFRYATICGVFLSLSVLTKYAAVSLYVVFFVILYLDYLLGRCDEKGFLKKSVGYLIVIVVSLIGCVLLLPAIWVNSKLLWTITFAKFGSLKVYLFALVIILYLEIFLLKGKITGYIKSRVGIEKILFISACGGLSLTFITLVVDTHFRFLNLDITTAEYIRKGSSDLLKNYLRSMRPPLNFSTTPVLFALLLLLPISLIPRCYRAFQDKIWLTLYLLVTVFIYILGTAANGLIASVRYQVILMPVYAMITSILFLNFTRRIGILTVVTGLILFMEALWFSPFYLSYVNQFVKLQKPPKAGVSWGMGGYEIAQAANNLSGAEKLNILSDYVGFYHFFIGKNEVFRRPITADVIKQYDYLCLSNQGRVQAEMKTKLITDDLLPYYEMPKENCVAYVGNDSHYVKLVKVNK